MDEDGGAAFIDSWKAVDSNFDSFQRLKELRALVARGAVSQEVYDTLHRYALEQNMSSKAKKKLERQASKAPANLRKMHSVQTPVSKMASFASMGRSASTATAAGAGAAADEDGAASAAGSERSDEWGDRPVMEGFLFKRAIKSGRNWRKRYVRLYYDRLDYFSDKKDEQPRGSIPITAELYVSDSIIRRIKNSRDHGFIVSDFGVTYYLAASSAERKVHWMRTIRRVIQKLKDSSEALDVPMLLDRPAQTKSMNDKALKQRLEAYRKANHITEVPVAKAKAKTQTKAKAKATKKAKKKAAKEAKKAALAAGTEVEVEGDNDAEAEDSRSRASIRAAEAAAATAPLKSALKRAEAGSSAGNSAAPPQEEEEGATIVLSDEEDEEDDGEGALDARAFKARSMASDAVRAHQSARQSAKLHLGMDVVSWEEQVEMQEAETQAELTKLVKQVETEAALAEMDQVLEQEEVLKEALEEARGGDDEDKVHEIEQAYEEAVDRIDELDETAARSAAEAAEAEELAEYSRGRRAKAEAANAIVLELAAVDEAILLAEQLADDAEQMRVRAEAAAVKVQSAAVQEVEDKAVEAAEADEEVRRAEAEERLRAEQEEAILAKLEATASTKVKQKQLERMEAAAAKAKEQRELAEEQRFQAEVRATEVASERLDAAAKAKAVEAALRETHAILAKERREYGMDEGEEERKPAPSVAFATRGANRQSRNGKGNGNGNGGGSGNRKKSGVAAAAAAAVPQSMGGGRGSGSGSNRALSKNATDASSKTRKSLVAKLRPRRSLDKSKKLKELERLDEERQLAERKAKAVARANSKARKQREEAEAAQAGEATSSFQSFFQSFVTGVEYVTGLELTDKDAEAMDKDRVEREARGDGDDDTLTEGTSMLQSQYTDYTDYTDDFDDDDYNDAFDEQLRNVGEQERIKAASAWIEFEMNRLIDVIEDIGREDEYGRKFATFHELVDIYQDLSDTLVGILLRAKRAGRIYYEGDMLFEGESSNVEIVVLDSHAGGDDEDDEEDD